MEPYDVIVNQPVVIDNGSGVIKAGFAGDQVNKFKRKMLLKPTFHQGSQMPLPKLHWPTKAQ